MVAALILAAYRLPAVGTWAILAGLGVAAQLEFYALVRKAGIPVHALLGTLLGVIFGAATFFGTYVDGSVTTGFWREMVLLASVLAIFVRQFPDKANAKPLESIACTLLGILYVPYLINWITLLACSGAEAGGLWKPLDGGGRLAVFYLVLVVKGADVGAYFVGSRFGRHKMFPRISPAKSWEGLLGGIGASVLASLLFCYQVGGDFGSWHMDLLDAVVLGVLLALAGVLGDLFESLIKRATGCKDSSAAIPGMGGLLDVLDSLLFGAPVMYLYGLLIL